MSKKNLLKKARGKKVGYDSSNNDEEKGEMGRWPDIPGGTMTGIRTFIRGGETPEGEEEPHHETESQISSPTSGSDSGYGRSWDNVSP